jgi:predicted NAD-dependent protein-ADP-ribosyltransferase YbiA (DUF1768 family)
MEDKLCFFSNSRDADPGKGANERVENPESYAELKKIVNWRRILSNFHHFPFHYDDKVWISVEHAFQAKKVSLECKETAKTFSMNSGSDLSRSQGYDARKAGRGKFISVKNLELWDVMKHSVMEDIVRCRFGDDVVSRNISKKTGSAQLWHNVPRMKIQRMLIHEKIRSESS